MTQQQDPQKKPERPYYHRQERDALARDIQNLKNRVEGNSNKK